MVLTACLFPRGMFSTQGENGSNVFVMKMTGHMPHYYKVRWSCMAQGKILKCHSKAKLKVTTGHNHCCHTAMEQTTYIYILLLVRVIVGCLFFILGDNRWPPEGRKVAGFLSHVAIHYLLCFCPLTSCITLGSLRIFSKHEIKRH